MRDDAMLRRPPTGAILQQLIAAARWKDYAQR